MSIFIVTVKNGSEQFDREVKKDSFTIGRGNTCDICLNDSHISRVHLNVMSRGNEIWITDNNSSNGTFINSNKLHQGAVVQVSAADEIKLGKSEYILTFSLKAVLPEVRLVPVKPEPVSEETVNVARSHIQSLQAEQILHDAKKKAAQIVLEGEQEAEKRTQAIYQLARETRDKAEKTYQKRMEESHKQADAVLQDAQNQGQELIKEARKMAQGLREEVDGYVQSLKDKAMRESEEMLSIAKTQAREIVKRETEDLQKNLADKKQSFDKLSKELIDIEAQLSKAMASLQNAKEQDDKLRQKSRDEEERLNRLQKEKEFYFKELKEKEEARLNDLIADEKNRLKNLVEKEKDRLAGVIEVEEERIKDLREAQKIITDEKNRLEAAVHTLREKQVQSQMAVQELEDKKMALAKDFDLQKKSLAENFENEKLQIEKKEQQYLEETRLEMTKRVQKLEQDYLDSLIQKKVSLVKKLYTVFEKEAVTAIEAAQWAKLSKGLEPKIVSVLDSELVSLSQSTVNGKKTIDLIKKKESEKLGWITTGIIAGSVVLFVTQKVIDKVIRNQNPFQNMVTMEAKKRQEDLEKRRFNPDVVLELRETYTDAVIYTKSFVQNYTDEQFQQKFYKALSQYLLKTWRIDEDKSIQVLSASNALVKSLDEKKQKIHPDFVREGIEKMRLQETEVLANIKNILGSEVRLESYRTFERNFYKQNVP